MAKSLQLLCIVLFVICAFQPSLSKSVHIRKKRMISGSDAEQNGYPYMVQLRFAKNGVHRCGASLIDQSHLLTAAHCVFYTDFECLQRKGLNKNGTHWTELHQKQVFYLKESNECPDVINITQFTVHLGAHERNDTDAIEAKVKRIIPNPYYEYYDFKNRFLHDIAIIEIEPVALNENVSVIELWPFSTVNSEWFPPWATGTLTGWGVSEISVGDGRIIYEERVQPDQLQVMQMPIYSFEDCKRLAKPPYLTNGKFCVGYLEKNFKGACWGDSGSPLVYTWGGVRYQLGIGSHLTGKPPFSCAMPGELTAFEEVYFHLEWINQVIGKGKTVV